MLCTHLKIGLLHVTEVGAEKHQVVSSEQSRLDNERSLFLGSLLFLGEERMDGGDDTSVGDDDVVKELVQLLVVTDGDHDVTGDDTDTLVIARSVSGKLENLGGQVLQNGGEVDGGSDTDTASILTLLKLTVETTDGEGKTGLVGAGLIGTGLSLRGGGRSLLGHCAERGKYWVRKAASGGGIANLLLHRQFVDRRLLLALSQLGRGRASVERGVLRVGRTCAASDCRLE